MDVNTYNYLNSIPLIPVDSIEVDIPMTPEGWWTYRNAFPICSGIYIVRGKSPKPQQRVLRVGMAAGKKGIYGRWFLSQSAHYYVWLHTHPKNRSYQQFYDGCAAKYPMIQLQFLLYPNIEAPVLRNIERFLIQLLCPVWENKTQRMLFKE